MMSLLVFVGCSSDNLGEGLDEALLSDSGVNVILNYSDQDLYTATKRSCRCRSS